jgi:hypothetical protein
VKWEKASRNEVPKTRPRVPAAEALVVKANSLLRGNPTCSQMAQASKLLGKASDLYGRHPEAKEAGDGTLRTLARRAAPGGWLEQPVEDGTCR